MRQFSFLLFFATATFFSTVGYAQQPIRPITKSGSCPLGYYSSGNYCVPSSSGNTRGAIEKKVVAVRLVFLVPVITASVAQVMNGKQSKKLVAHVRLGGLARVVIALRVAEPLRQLGITPAAQVILPAITTNILSI